MRQTQLVDQHLELTTVKRQQERDKRADVKCEPRRHTRRQTRSRAFKLCLVKSIQFRPAIGENRYALADGINLGQVDRRSEHHLGLAGLDQGFTPRIDECRSAKEGVAAGRTDAIAGCHKALVLDRAARSRVRQWVRRGCGHSAGSSSSRAPANA